MKLENKRVVLTGAASGIGRCVALQLATEGCDLVLVDRDRTPLLELCDQLRETGAEVEPVTHDLGELGSLAKLWDDIAILPVQESSGDWEGSEYVGVYRTIQYGPGFGIP